MIKITLETNDDFLDKRTVTIQSEEKDIDAPKVIATMIDVLKGYGFFDETIKEYINVDHVWNGL